MTEKFYGIDFGGTNLRVAEVNPENGEIIGESLSANITDIACNQELLSLIESKITKESNIGICAAGNVDELNLIVKSSPNSKIKGEITFAKELEKKGNKVSITNDMKAAVQAASKYGLGKGLDNVLVATYSSGYNFAVVRKGNNVSTAEFGHIIYNPSGDLYCGCGGKGHLEIYVSGNGAALIAKTFFISTHITKHPIIDSVVERLYNGSNENSFDNLSPKEFISKIVCNISSFDVYNAYRLVPNLEPQCSIQRMQSKAIASSFGMMNSAYNPLDIMVLMGSQTKDWDILFEPAIKLYNEGNYQLPSLTKPKIVRTEMSDIGIIGAVAYFLNNIK